MRFMHGWDLSVSSKYQGFARLISSITSVFRPQSNEDRLEDRKLMHATDSGVTLFGSRYSTTGRSDVATNISAFPAKSSTFFAPITSSGETRIREIDLLLCKSFANEAELDSLRKLRLLNFATLELAQ